VEVDRNIRAQPVACASDQLRGSLRCCDSDRVDDDDFLRTRLDRRLVHRLEVRRVGPRAVDAEEGDGHALRNRVRDRVNDPFEHRLAVDAERLELEIGDRRLDHTRLHAELHERLHIGLDRAREAPDLCLEIRSKDQLDGAAVVLGDARESRLDPLDSQLVEPARELELVLGAEDDSNRLLAVPERRVVEAHLRVEAVWVVEPAGPKRHWLTRKSSG
jgi:hypothetical protein